MQTSDAIGAAASQLGPNAQALAVCLNKEAGLSHGKVAWVFESVFGIALTRGGSARIMLRAAERTTPDYEDIVVHVRKSRSVTPDETGWKVGGVLTWLWAFATDAATAYAIRPSRGRDVAEEMLGSEYDGILVRDGWAVYDGFEKAEHQLCVAHVVRRCREMMETATGAAVRFPRDVKAVFQDALELRDRRDTESISNHGLAVARGRMENRLDRLLLWPRTNEANERLAVHLLNHRVSLFTFLRHPGIDATNWRAEQAIRPAVVNRKVWGGNRTESGAEAQAKLMSVLRTCAQRRRDGIEYLSCLLCSHPLHAPPILALDSRRFLPALPVPA